MTITWSDPLVPRAPFKGESLDTEPFDEWWARVGPELPHIPTCVAKNWIHAHWGKSPYVELPIDELRFVRQSWSIEQANRIFDDESLDRFSDWTKAAGVPGSFHAKHPVAQYMSEHGTWPVPIIVLDNPSELLMDPSNNQPFARFALLEGHKRTAYFRHFMQAGQVRAKHDVWLVTWAQ